MFPEREKMLNDIEATAKDLRCMLAETMLRDSGGDCDSKRESKAIAHGMVLDALLYVDTQRKSLPVTDRSEPADIRQARSEIEKIFLEKKDSLDFDAMREELADQDAEAVIGDNSEHSFIKDVCLNGPSNIYGDMCDLEILEMYVEFILEHEIEEDSFPSAEPRK